MSADNNHGPVAASEARSFRPEIVIGFVAPTGIRYSQVKPVVSSRLERYGYEVTEIHVSGLLDQVIKVEDEIETDRIDRLQDLGNSIRKESKTGAALAHLAVMAISTERAEWRRANSKEAAEAHGACAYLVWSLKRPEEIALLRTVYGSRFYLISLFAPTKDRLDWLTAKTLTTSRGDFTEGQCRDKARVVIDRDQAEGEELGPQAGKNEAEDFGQQVGKAYPLADFFIDARDHELQSSINRAIDLIFGAPFETPTRDEFGMAVAQAASLQSAEPGRQVGAAVLSDKGDLVATGTNEVPLFGGGHYWTSDPLSDDHREFRHSPEMDTSDKEKQRIADQAWKAIRSKEKTPPAAQVYAYFEATGLDAVTEFGRAVHGEMGALMDAARRGVSVAGLTMYVTTFPCHQCTRHIIAAGVHRLVYVYPYAKSRAKDLHGDSIELEGDVGNKVRYESFLGVAPTAYVRFFNMPKRKKKTGELEPVEDFRRVPRLPEGHDEGRWDGQGYLESEKRSNEACEKWLDRVFRTIRSSVGTQLDNPSTSSL
jgi:deoxycytidylate deaminase